MHRSARTAQTIRPSRSGSSTIQPATGQAAWQIEHANAPKQRSGSMTAMVFGAFLRGPDIIFVHMSRDYSRSSSLGEGTAQLQAVRSHESSAQTVDELPIVVGKTIEETVDRLDDDAPLRETSHHAQCVESGLEFVRHTNAELRVILDLLSVARAGGRPAHTAS